MVADEWLPALAIDTGRNLKVLRVGVDAGWQS
jgi:hypothetical protein